MNPALGRYTVVMANFTSKVQGMLRNPKTRQMIDKARVAANKPENREKIRQLSSRLTSRGRGRSGAGHGPGSHGAGGPAAGGHGAAGPGAGGQSAGGPGVGSHGTAGGYGAGESQDHGRSAF